MFENTKARTEMCGLYFSSEIHIIFEGLHFPESNQNLIYLNAQFFFSARACDASSTG